MEVCVSTKATKYLYKYVHKGGDRAMVHIDDQQSRNEIKEYQDLRQFGSPEASWRLFENPMSDRFPPVVRLRCHLQNQHTIYFHEDAPLPEIVDGHGGTELTAFFRYNSQYPQTNVSYIDFPTKFRYVKGLWKLRKRDAGYW